MPVKDKAAYNEYMRQYMLRKYHKQRKKIIKALGGKCQKCGSKKNLELDHENKDTKMHDVARCWSEVVWKEEIKKCQLLCKSCHTIKSIEERGMNVAKGTHGTLSAYRYCKCELCKGAKREYNRERRRKRFPRLQDL